MNARHLIPLAACLATLSTTPGALANAEGPGTPQATAANATFLSSAPAPATGGGICVIDSGVDTDTDLGPALAGRVAQIGGVSGDPSDFGATSDTGDSRPKHGTYVAGIIASQIDGKGTGGIWPAAKVYSSRVFAGGSMTTAADYIRALNWCESQSDVKVVNLSLSGLASATTSERANLNDKIAEVRAAPYKMNVVASAGNNGSLSTVGYPALADGVFAVGATDAAGVLAPFSNRGTGLDIATFGTETCVSTSHGTHLASGAGTSFAAPVVSAVLAALRSYDPSLTPDQAETLLLNNAETVAGVKVLNAAKAFRANTTVSSLATGAPTTGLGGLVLNACDAPHAPASVSGGGGGASGGPVHVSKAPEQAPPTVVLPTPVPPPIIDAELPPGDSLAALKPATPILRSVTYRRGVLTVRVSGFRSGEHALFTVSCRVKHRHSSRTVTKSFVRESSTLKARVPNWTRIRVQLQRPGVGTSKVLVVRPNSDF
jgi:subtilisin family serine protease